MSWAEYIKNLEGSGHLKYAAIVGHEGTVWAASTGLNVPQSEVKDLMSSLKDPLGQARTAGIVVNGVKYYPLTLSDRAMYGKKGNDGVVVVKTAKALIIGVYGANQHHGRAVNAVEQMADYLSSHGY